MTAWVDARFELVASPALLDELAGVLARPKFHRRIGPAVARELVDGLADDVGVRRDAGERRRRR